MTASLHRADNFTPASTQQIDGIVAPFLYPYPANTATSTLAYTAGNAVGSIVTVPIAVRYNLILPF